MYTLRLWHRFKDDLPLSTADWKICTGLLGDDPLGLYIRRKIDLPEAKARIIKMAGEAELASVAEFFDLLSVYYQVDSGGYTRCAFPKNMPGFIEKPKLEAVFAHDRRGDLIYSPELGRLMFSPGTEAAFANLRAAVGG